MTTFDAFMLASLYFGHKQDVVRCWFCMAVVFCELGLRFWKAFA